MKTKKFIEVVYLNELPEMTLSRKNNSYAYLGFYLIAAGIEFLGACLDNNDWNRKGESEKRFKKAIKNLFSNNYKNHSNNLYNHFRCSILHASQPGSSFSLSQGGNNKSKHLTKKNGKVILIYEIFLDDFLKACKETINKIDNHNLPHQKIYIDKITITKNL